MCCPGGGKVDMNEKCLIYKEKDKVMDNALLLNSSLRNIKG